MRDDILNMVEQAPYEVIGKIGSLEIRRYPKLVLAIAIGIDNDDAFGHLFNYIAGNNRKKVKIPMTAPVLSEQIGEKVPMTAPVINEEGGMAFVLPAAMTADTAPEPLDEKIKIVNVPSRTMAVLRFKGHANEMKTEEMTDLMLGELANENVPIIGRPILMRYDPPFKPGFLRRNEVAVEIRWEK